MKNDIIIQKVAEKIAVGDKIAIAVSGGIDSMVLLHAFMQLRGSKPFKFFVINIEHGIRGAASKKDTAFVLDFCKKNNIDVVCKTLDVPSYSAENGGTIEECARKLRYAEFDALLANGDCNKVALAHHLSDQAETIFMRILRGTGLRGLEGMKDENGRYIRPLLEVSKEEIRAYQAKHDIKFIIDETNLDNNYTRNKIRNEIIPLLHTLSQNAEGGFLRLSRIASEAEEFISNYDNPIRIEKDVAIMDIIENEPKLLFKRRVLRCMEALGVNKDVEEINREQVYKLLDASNSAKLSLPYGVVAHREYDKIVFSRQSTHNTQLSVPFCTGEVAFGDETLTIEAYDGGFIENGELLLDISKIPQTAVLRYRRSGDTFTKFGGGTKSLGDYLTDKKVPLRLRDKLIVCADGSEILFIAGIEISHKVRVDFNDVQNRLNIYKVTKEA